MAIYSLANEVPVQANLTGTFGAAIVVAQTQSETLTTTKTTTNAASDGSVVVLEGAPGQETLAASNHGNELTTGTAAQEAEDSYPFPPFDTTTFGPQIFWLTISFALLYILMSKVALPKVGEVLEVRRDRIEGDLAEAERLRQKTEQAISAYESELAEARAKSQAIAEETRANLKGELDKKRLEVELDLSKTIATAEARIQKTKADALSNVDEIASDTAVALVAKLTGKISIKAARNAVASIVKD